MFEIKRKEWSVHKKIMNTPGATTTWYAFKDPKTGREYFHEPNSEETSWVLPTSSSNATRADKATGSGGHGMMTGLAEKGGGNPAMNARTAKSKRKRMERLSAVGMTVVSLLVFNTLFLSVIVIILYESNIGRRQMPDVIEPSAPVYENRIQVEPSRDDVVETTQKQKVVIDADPKYLLKEDIVSANHQMDNASYTTLSDVTSKGKVDVVEDAKNTPKEPASVTSSPEVSKKSYSSYILPEPVVVHDTVSADETPKEVEEEVNNKGPSTQEEGKKEKVQVENKKTEEGEGKGIGEHSLPDRPVWVAVLVEKCQQLRNFFAKFFDRLLHGGLRGRGKGGKRKA
mmetsp:Transcript_8098/g.14188  ORF Transcript_8098/g.14188 Transcript_8098/m.14188 type:complete len:342 (+) Transcript_8098:84-1109(+)